jgi:glutathione S-transferase
MGAWSHEPFGNDDAGDWAYGLQEADDLLHIEAALDAVLGTEGYLEADEACCAVAAVEVLAKLLGKGTQSDAYTEKVDEWVKRVRTKPSRQLLEKARAALARVRGEESELKELWHEGDATEWEASLDSLQAAVSA